MTQAIRSHRIYAGPRTWALAREAYLSGETAQAVCDRLGLKTDALRAQAHRHGWTKRAYADSMVEPDQGPLLGARPAVGEDHASIAPPKGPVDPILLAHAALREAGHALSNGRLAEAATQLKMVESLARLAEALPPPPAPALSEEERDRQEAAEVEAYRQEVWRDAERIAKAMLTDGVGLSAIHTRAVFAWRAEHLGPQTAAADRARADEGGWASRVYDEAGRIRPPEPS